MKRSIAILLGAVLALGAGAGEAASRVDQADRSASRPGAEAPGAAGGLHEKTLENVKDLRFQSRRYLVYLPPGYEPGQRKRWPLLIYLHGHTNGKINKTMDMLRDEGPFRWMKRSGEPLDAIVAAPLTEDVRLLNGVGHNEFFVEAVIRQVQKDYPVDARRISITGFSLGGQGTWTMLLAYPRRFAAAAPLAGALYPERRNRAMAPDEAWGRAFATLRGNVIRAYHSRDDEVVPFAFGERPTELAREAGVRVDFTAISGTHMQTPDAVYSRELFDWLIRQRRAGASGRTRTTPAGAIAPAYGERQPRAAHTSSGTDAIWVGGPDPAVYRYLGDMRFMLISDDRRAYTRQADFVWFTGAYRRVRAAGAAKTAGAAPARCYRSAAAPRQPGPWTVSGVDAQGKPCS